MDARSYPPAPAWINTRNRRKTSSDLRSGDQDSLRRIKRYHPRFGNYRIRVTRRAEAYRCSTAIAREHGFQSWPNFAKHIDA